MIKDAFGKPVQEANLIASLDVHDRSHHGELMVDLDGRREGCVERVVLRRVPAAADLLGLGKDSGIKILVLNERRLDGACKRFHGGLILDDAAPGFHHIERIDGNMVGARNDLGAENIQAGDTESARQLVEKPGPIPGNHVHDGQAAVEIILPVDDGPQRAYRVGLADRFEQPVDHLDVQGDLVRLGVEKITLRKQIEMRRDLILTDAWNLFGNQFLVDHLCSLQVSFFDCVAEKETIEGSAEKGRMEGVFVTIPERGGGSAGIAKRVNVKIPKLFSISNQIGKGRGRLWIIQIMLLPESCHDQMIFNNKRDDIAASRVYLEGFENRDGQLDAALAVILYPDGLADVVQE